MLRLIIPPEIPGADRLKALNAAHRTTRRHEIIMEQTRKRGDIGAYRHARGLYARAMEAERAWQSVQRPEAVA